MINEKVITLEYNLHNIVVKFVALKGWLNQDGVGIEHYPIRVHTVDLYLFRR